MELSKRIATEKKIVHRVFQKLKEIEFFVCQVEDEPVDSNEKAYAEIFDLDEAWVTFKSAEGKSFWIIFVFGNDGWDVIADYLVLDATNAVMDEMHVYCNNICDEEC